MFRIAKKKIGKTIQKGDLVELYHNKKRKSYSFIEQLPYWIYYDKENRKMSQDDSKRIKHEISEQRLDEYFRTMTPKEFIIGKCNNCHNEIHVGEKHLEDKAFVDASFIYCANCFKEHTVTEYYVDGYYVGSSDENCSVKTV